MSRFRMAEPENGHSPVAALIVIAVPVLSCGFLVAGYLSPGFDAAPRTSRALHESGLATVSQPGDVAESSATRAALPVQAVRLDFLSAPVDLFGIAILLLTASSGWVWRRQPASGERVATAVLVLSTVGLAGVVWCLYQVGFLPNLVALRYRVVAAGLLTLAAVASVYAPSGPIILARQALAACRLLVASTGFWAGALGVVLIVASKALIPSPMRTDPSAPSGAAFEPWFMALPELADTLIPWPLPPASVTVARFLDYQCAPCREAESAYRPTLEALARSNRVQIIQLDFPLDPECNATVAVEVHAAACEAAVAVRLAREVGHHEAMEAWLWANQEALTAEAIEHAAAEVASVPDYRGRYESALIGVRRDAELAAALGVMGTPSYLVNRKLLRLVPPADFRRAVELELARRRN